jgi:hypothetical protein
MFDSFFSAPLLAARVGDRTQTGLFTTAQANQFPNQMRDSAVCFHSDLFYSRYNEKLTGRRACAPIRGSDWLPDSSAF